MQGRNVLVCGRVIADAENGKLTFATAMLEGANGVRVRLEFKNYKGGRASLFNGQMLVVEGACAQYGGSRTIMVERLYEGEPWPAPARFSFSQGSSVWVASGPFTSVADLTYEPLSHLMADVKDGQPSVLILLGPFVDANHPALASARPNA